MEQETQNADDKRIKLLGGSKTIQIVFSPKEDKVIEKYKYEWRIRNKKEVVKKIVREFDKLKIDVEQQK